MSDKVHGYKITLKAGTKLLAGNVELGHDIDAVEDETLIKENSGVKQYETIDTEESLSISNLHYLKATGEAETHLDLVDIKAAIRAGTTFAYSYGQHESGKPIETGTLKFTKYSEKNGSEKKAGDISVTARIIGDATPTTYST